MHPGNRRRASKDGLAGSARTGAHTCARCLDYPKALVAIWPDTTGIIEGPYRHSVKGSMDLTGARSSVDGAEVVLGLRSRRSNDDVDEYWRFHLSSEMDQVHRSR
jgi:hypothetical protein